MNSIQTLDLTYEEAHRELEILKTNKENELLVADSTAKPILLREYSALQIGLDAIKTLDDRNSRLKTSKDYLETIESLKNLKMRNVFNEEELNAINTGISALEKLCDLQIKLENHNKIR